MSTAPSRRRDITAAALRVFARKGYRRAVVADVAAEAGVSKGTIYTYFSRKEHLLGAVFDRLVEEAAVRRRQIADSDRRPLDKIRALLHVVADVYDGDESRAAALLDLWTAALRDPQRFGIDFTSAHDETRRLLRDLLEEAERQGDIGADRPETTPALLLAASEGVFLHGLLDPDAVDVSAHLNDLVDLCYRGLRAPPDSPAKTKSPDPPTDPPSHQSDESTQATDRGRGPDDP
jgi:TetR/AcrR family fatty acid metabolism transcriptional regulator